MYSDKFKASLQLLTNNREQNAAYEPQRMSAEQKEEILKKYHPDHREDKFATLKVGKNKGDKVPAELCGMLCAHSRIKDIKIGLEKPDYEDGIVAACLVAESADIILTRDGESFNELDAAKYSPAE
ncbi:MAG: hypothetical protein IKH51_06070, partial [Clostridia bacterium]|nr:hypothetical protein [Clostridia bacterium]